jgi:hypothetical protein
MSAWGGISTLGLGLSLLWTEGQKRGVTLKEVVDWMSTRTAKHAGLQNRKGQLKIGYDGDFLIWDKDAEFEVFERLCFPDLRTDNLLTRSWMIHCNTRIRFPRIKARNYVVV